MRTKKIYIYISIFSAFFLNKSIWSFSAKAWKIFLVLWILSFQMPLRSRYFMPFFFLTPISFLPSSLLSSQWITAIFFLYWDQGCVPAFSHVSSPIPFTSTRSCLWLFSRLPDDEILDERFMLQSDFSIHCLWILSTLVLSLMS